MESAEPPSTSALLENDELDFAPESAAAGADAPTSFAQPERTYPIVEVVAPETLSAGYTFDVEYNHEIFTVQVPPSGVFKGQTFTAQTKAAMKESSHQLRIPVGGWKDSLFDFCKYGPFHPSLCLAVFCPLVAIGQIFTRLGLTWNAAPSENPYNNSSTSFKIMVAISFAYFCIFQIVNPASFALIHNLHIIHILYAAYLAGKTRAYIRDRYDIPASDATKNAISKCGCGRDDENGGCDLVEDYVLACVCGPCTITQMARHTAMYDTYGGSFMNSNGLPRHAPNMV
mmetsp:Transcript_20792/g.30471  ORF Transcript_20792/g.30471 Transcript_20792/m.30471 type:complete len:286 (-) Transcript_20792:571-1428(-)|eukprot:CAMPEP_0197233570 /NCGR_PEP_ID=MMETSP1429-20130617/1595_1 /TAXON_ID=49237 /ORGANISM="Chaetoceros  sp., Strain UNC1202" /LENGTH=285 /DNA_ID=CAMNT_0042691833 /DNA_START=79 /DNA_END=936 /DNA_ORIENTATION=-